jgi:hypothetical protein
MGAALSDRQVSQIWTANHRFAEYDRPAEVAEPLRGDYNVVVVDTAEAAFQICTTCKVNLVITRAVFREGMNGVELVDRLATVPSPPRVYLVTPFRLAILNALPGFRPPGVPIVRNPILTGVLVNAAGFVLNELMSETPN